MKNILALLAFVTLQSNAGMTLDLTDPDLVNIADQYPDYQAMKYLNFDDTAGKFSLTGFKENIDDDDWDPIFSAYIGLGNDAKQRVYIGLPKDCSDRDESYDILTIKANGQNVRFFQLCDGKNIYLSAFSAAGDKYVIREFQEKKVVKFELAGFPILFSAEGFTKAWDNYGGDAL